MLTGNYKTLSERLSGTIAPGRIFHDPLYTLALGTDASFYRLVPRMVIRAIDENEVSLILKECSILGIPVTFRAAGTSLSGQAVTDSVLIIAGSDWKKYSLSSDNSLIRLQPGLTGGRVNRILAPAGKKIGPDPASINAAMIGGIAANNASGMCCGTAQNTYRTVSGIRIILSDGTILDTTDRQSREAFALSHPEMLAEISGLATKVRADTQLLERITKKFRIKNTTGYSLNALADYTDPFDIIEHLMIGSEGTLGFIAEICLNTVPEYRHRASALIIFSNLEEGCRAVTLLSETPVAAVELIDRAGLRAVENEKGVPASLRSLPAEACALLVETTAGDKDALNLKILEIKKSISGIKTLSGVHFTDISSEYELLWKVRKGLFPSVGAVRKTGTTVIIEDVAFPVERLAEATLDLRALLEKYGYHEAVIFGHALEGNLHFVFTQDFGSAREVGRYGKLMNEVAELVVNKYDGSLKAEHGTGRNMAPFVEMEWGHQAYALMKEIKRIFDPKGILNPGVILNESKDVHLRNLKPMPAAFEVADKCTECGFCEPGCVSAGLTLTPRQRIVIHRELNGLRSSGKEPHLTAALASSFSYAGDQTCATDGLCATECPVKIDTGKLIKELRAETAGKNDGIAMMLARHMSLVTSMARMGLKTAAFFHRLAGSRLTGAIASGLRIITFGKIPAWNRYMPGGADKIKTNHPAGNGLKKVVYFPSCINRSMGVSDEYRSEKQLSEKLTELLRKGGYEPVYPGNMNELCCGMAFLSKGYVKAGEMKAMELEKELLRASNNGEYPVLCDMSPCLFTIKEHSGSKLSLYEPVGFITEFLLPNLTISKLDETITVFPVCSMKKMGLEGKLAELAGLCAREVIVSDANCCGFAGDRGFTYPELNRHGLKDVAAQLPGEVRNGYSTSRTCEIGLSLHTGITHKSIVYLVDQVSRAADR